MSNLKTCSHRVLELFIINWSQDVFCKYLMRDITIPKLGPKASCVWGLYGLAYVDISLQKQGDESVLLQCRASVVDSAPTLK